MSRFERAMKVIAVHEGGYSNHPKDPGGSTMKGVTQRTYDAHRKRTGLTPRSVKNISDTEVNTIYREQYWNAIRGDDLPNGVAYCVFDAAVNSGAGRAARWLQEIIGAKQDGIVGNDTVAKARAIPAVMLIDAYCDTRLAFMKRLKHWSSFQNGWTRRVSEVRKQSKAWASGNAVADSTAPITPKAEGEESTKATLKDMLTDRNAIGAAGGAIGSAGALASGDGPLQYALAAILVLVALVGVWWLVKGRHQ